MSSLSRRRFTRLIALSGSAAFLPPGTDRATLELDRRPLRPTPVDPDEKFWAEVRGRFVLPPDFAFFNAANLAPTALPVLEALEQNTRRVDADPSTATRAALGKGREDSRRRLADFLGVTAEEIVITRNTSEANNLVVNGLDLERGDEVLLFADNHPSNLAAWQERAKRFGISVVTVPQLSPHPGPEHYLAAFERAVTTRTKVLGVTHVTNTVGDRLPVTELCRMARERGIISLVDGAQTFGVLEVNLRQLGCDLYSGSAHKWLCGPKETGVLFVNRAVQDRIWPSVVSLYGGAVGVSQKLESMGQRDESALAALGEAVVFQQRIGRAAIERRARELTEALVRGLQRMESVMVWTHPASERSAAVVAFRPGALDSRKLAQALYQKDRIAVATRGGDDRPGLRAAPHIYNSIAEVERLLGAVAGYLKRGV
jgi:selenocysteine lyase/cysteine desulfurase